MAELILKQGCEVTHQGKKYRIASPISLEQVLLEEPETGQKIRAKISELAPCDDKSPNTLPNTTDLILFPIKIGKKPSGGRLLSRL